MGYSDFFILNYNFFPVNIQGGHRLLPAPAPNISVRSLYLIM